MFWAAANPSFRVPGEFTAKVGDKAEVSLTKNLVADPRVSIHRDPERKATVLAVSGSPVRSVASFQPITLHGHLDTDEPVTLLEAQNYGSAGRQAPRYRAPSAVLGAHVSGDQRYSAVRFRIDRPHWTGHLTDGDSSAVEDDGSTLSIEASDDGNWLLYESSAPITLRQIEIRVTSACLALLHLALYPDEDRATRETQVRINAAGPWLTVYGSAFHAEPGDAEYETLLTREHLTIDRFAKWIALHDRLDGLPWVVARPISGAVLDLIQGESIATGTRVTRH